MRAANGRNLAHDFRNMLQCATSALRVARRRIAGPAEGDLAAGLDDALGALERANLLAHRMVAADGKEETPEPVSVSAVLLSMRGLLRHALGDDIRLETLVFEDLRPVLCDSSQLENVLLNLAMNSRDAMPDGGALIIEARRCRAAAHGAGCVTLSVIDSGSGMPPEIAREAFRPFFTTKASGGGTGLGLHNVWTFVDKLGGEVEIHSSNGAGTRVDLHLPACSAGRRA
jgi:signal transduction histidine kinase